MSIKQTLLLTGSSSGIGSTTAKLLLENGYRIIGLARRKQESFHPNFIPYQIDLEQIENISTCIRQLFLKYPDLSGVIANAGKGLFGHLEQLAQQEILSCLQLNLTSHILLVKEALPFLKKKKQSNLIFLGSEASLQGQKRGSIYAAAKFGLRGFAQSIREECRNSNTKVSMILPGMTKTPFYQSLSFTHGKEVENWIDPQDIAKAILLILKAKEGTLFDEITLSPHKKVITKKEPFNSDKKHLKDVLNNAHIEYFHNSL